MHLESQLEDSKQHIQLLEQRNQQLAWDRDLLSAQVAALQSSFVMLTNSLGQNGHIVDTVATSSANEADRDLSPDDYKHVNFWTCSKWTLHVQAEKAVTKLGSSSTSTQRGLTRLAKGKNVACQFIEDATGVPVNGHRAKAAHSVFTTYLHQLNQAGVKLPSSWSQVPLDLKEGFYHAIRMNYIEFRYCTDNWKAEHLATQNYSQWQLEERMIKATTSQDDGKAAESSTSLVKKPKTRVTAPDESDLEYMDIDIPPCVTSNQSPVVIASPTHDTLNDFIDPALKALSAFSNPNNPPSFPIAIAGTIPEARESEPVAVPATTTNMPATMDALAGCSKPCSSRTNEEKSSLVIPEVKNPLFCLNISKARIAGVSGTFRLGGPTYTSTAPASSSSSSSSIPATLSPSTIPVTVNMIPVTTTTIPATTDTIPATMDVIPTTMDVINATMDMIPATTTIITKPKAKPKPHLVKATTSLKDPNAPSKAKVMCIQKTINAQNLCAAAWKSAGNLLGTAKQFKGYWEQLPAAEKAVFEAQAQTLLATNTLAATSTTASGP
ncbi:hypothetical protein BDR07DRAFT_1376296 [Suillus spraguei]|nr:hypothetical protein BDR07DRAFT_1376296 [Suillus spraguei]